LYSFSDSLLNLVSREYKLTFKHTIRPVNHLHTQLNSRSPTIGYILVYYILAVWCSPWLRLWTTVVAADHKSNIGTAIRTRARHIRPCTADCTSVFRPAPQAESFESSRAYCPWTSCTRYWSDGSSFHSTLCAKSSKTTTKSQSGRLRTHTHTHKRWSISDYVIKKGEHRFCSN